MKLNAQVLIVGSGPAGVSAAWPLVEAGVSVLMIDASEGSVPALPAHDSIAAFRRDPARMDFELEPGGGRGEQAGSPKSDMPLARAVMAGFAPAIDLQASGFLPTGSHAAGGLSRIWGALAMPWDTEDLSGFADRDDLLRSYDRVAQRIGLSRTDEAGILGQPALRVLSRHRSLIQEPGFGLEPASNAVLTSARDARQACNTCGLCLYGCSRGAIYHSALELPQLCRFPNFSYRPGLRVRRLIREGGSPGVETVSSQGPLRLLAARMILAAGTIATTSLALRYRGLVGQPFPLSSNPVGGMAFLVPSLVGRDLPLRSFGLGQLFYRQKLHSGATSVGVLYGADTLPIAPLAARMPLRGKTAMRLAGALAPGLLIASGYLPGRFSRNHVSVEEDGADGRVTIEGSQTDEAVKSLRESFGRLSRAMRRRGAWALPGSLTILQPGADAHAGASLPMCGNGPNATGPFGELGEDGRIFIADGASLPTLSAVHPTLTIMANADRIGRYVASHALIERAA